MDTCTFKCLLTPIAAVAVAWPAMAQTASSPAEVLPSVVVTASKRSQLLIDVPYSITAIGGSEIADRGVTDIQQMQSVVPSLFINQNAPGASRIQLRGLSQGVGFGAALVGTYLDEISLNMPDAQRSLDVPLVDMARIEVLRGPQGTLYGDGSMGGTIRFITRAPRLDKLEGSIEAGFSQVSGGQTGWRANGVVNVPLSTGVAGLRLVAGHEDLPGWVDNSANGTKDINSAKRDFLRGKLLVKPSANVEVSAMFFHTETDTKNGSGSNADRSIASYIASPTKDKTDLFNLVANVDLGSVRLVSSTGYLDRKIDTTAELTAVFAGAPFKALILPKPTSGGAYRQDMSQKITTQEIRLESDDIGSLTWTAGGYYRKTDTRTVTSDVWTDATFRLQGGFNGTGPTNVKQLALFGELTYALSPKLSLTGGLRSFKEKAENVGSKLPSGFAPPGTPSTLYDDHAEFSATTPRLNMLWRYAPKGALYATASKGFRSGGFNATATPRNYGPEDIVSFEIGNRGSLLGDTLQYEVAAYHNKYSNVQAQDLAPGCTPATCQALTVNSGKASGPGLDITLSAALTKSVTLDVALGYSDLAYDVTTAERNQGDPLNFVPKKTASVSLSQRFNWAPGLPGMVRLDYQHSDPVKFIIRNQGVNASGNSLDTLNARIGVEMPTWQLYLEGRNLTNATGVTLPGIFGLPDYRIAPRSIGVLARAQF
ncbi:TonB-dependent receptor [Roseateles toxinivorans]|uniref:Outer membrane receptor protein involved in Fe transport n=1 Tax=Roseateles toxinivorans TaxID=270368 RepID=A0A4R6QGZ4_9BURK|nr:TonB-dependent receptor [Roseateles toxinivorans]TDP61253.1 outer membrane receptor protein involved in Fe transport [Roseateles toxinivorans]